MGSRRVWRWALSLLGVGVLLTIGSTSLASNTVAPSHAGSVTVVVKCHPDPPDPPSRVNPPDPHRCPA
jgi:hypothetical protein